MFTLFVPFTCILYNVCLLFILFVYLCVTLEWAFYINCLFVCHAWVIIRSVTGIYSTGKYHSFILSSTLQSNATNWRRSTIWQPSAVQCAPKSLQKRETSGDMWKISTTTVGPATLAIQRMIARTTFDTIKGIVPLDVLVNVHQRSRLVQEVVKDQDIQFQKGTFFHQFNCFEGWNRSPR